MKRRVLSFLTTICLVSSFFPHTAFADDTQYEYHLYNNVDAYLYYTLDENGNATIVGTNKGNHYGTNIPAYIENHPVVRIESLTYMNSDNEVLIPSVTIPDSVTSIGDKAFYKFTIQGIVIPNSVISIGDRAFGSCKSLGKMTIPTSVITIGSYVFSGCTNLKTVVLPDTITEIPSYAFSSCTSLSEFSIPKSIISIGSNAFFNCTSLTEIEIPDSVTSIGEYAFYNCENLNHNLIIPDSVTSIGKRAFVNCWFLDNITIGDSVQTIDEGAFCSSPRLKRIQLPKSVTSIGKYALGYYLWSGHLEYINDPEKINGFIISGYCGTAAETYAMENGFTFERIHDPVDVEGTLPTCTEPGLSGGTKCSGCGEILSTGTSVIPATGHTPSSTWERAPSEHYHTCTVCGEKTDTTSHTYGDWTIKQEPAATVTGWKERTCTVCGYTQGESIPATGEVPPTPTSSPSPTPTPTASPSPTPTSTPTPSRPSGSSGSSSSRSDTYSITPPAASEQGSITVSPQRAEAGDRVIITVTPNEGYRLDTLAVKDRQGRELQLTQQEDGTYTFLMPSGPVTIEAEFFLLPVEVVMLSLPFTDVPDDSDYRDAVEYVYGNGLMNGTSETTFEPETETSRAMLVTILYRMEGEPSIKTASGFSDVPDGQWYTDAVNWAVKAGIITGFEDNTFRPEELVTKEHLITILYRYADYKGYDTAARESLEKYLDRDIVSPYAQDAMSWAEATKLLDESEVRTLSPGEKVRRRWIATMIMKFCENVIG